MKTKGHQRNEITIIKQDDPILYANIFFAYLQLLNKHSNYSE